LGPCGYHSRIVDAVGTSVLNKGTGVGSIYASSVKQYSNCSTCCREVRLPH